MQRNNNFWRKIFFSTCAPRDTLSGQKKKGKREREIVQMENKNARRVRLKIKAWGADDFVFMLSEVVTGSLISDGG